MKTWLIVIAVVLLLKKSRSAPAIPVCDNDWDIVSKLTTSELIPIFGYPQAPVSQPASGPVIFAIYPVYAHYPNRQKRSPDYDNCADKVHQSFELLGETINLTLEKSNHLSKDLFFQVTGRDKDVVVNASVSDICSYRMKSTNTTASVHLAGSDLEYINGYLTHGNTAYRIAPVPPRIAKRSINPNHGPMHILHKVEVDLVKDDVPEDANTLRKLKKELSQKTLKNSCAIDMKKECPNGKCKYDKIFGPTPVRNRGPTPDGSSGKPATLELAVFLDADAYKILSKFLGSDSAIRDLLLIFIDQVDLIFHLPSFGNSIDVKLVYVNILQNTPADISSSGEIEKTLETFSNYQKRLNPGDDSNPGHWDHAIYLTGKKLYRGDRDYSVMGMSRVGAMCDPLYSATVAEFGATDSNANFIQSSGFLSTYMVAHEMGHSLGLFHDGDSNTCTANGFIMAPVRAWASATTWSSCSQSVLNEKLFFRSCLYDNNYGPMEPTMDFKHFQKLPGQMYTANAQCSMQLKDNSYTKDPAQQSADICNSIQCVRRSGGSSTVIGPALDGTFCGGRNWCSSGKCVSWPSDMPVVLPGWSDWKAAACQSGCLEQSTGYKVTQRFCNKPEAQNTESSCQGKDYQVVLCSDYLACSSQKSVTKYAMEKCKSYADAGVPGITSEGKQMTFDSAKSLDRACAIYCKASDGSDLYRHPKNAVAMLLGQGAYFPDGTLCNSDGKNSYFCMDHQCVAG